MLAERASYCLQFPCNIQSRRNAGQQYNERHHNFTHLNKAVAVISSNISIPPMIPFILYGSYWTGAQVLQRDMPLSLSDITLERVAADLVQYIVGSFTMAAVCGAAATAVGYALLVLCKRTPGHE